MIPGKMGKMLKEAQKAQEKLQVELAELRVSGSAGGGVVRAEVDGQKHLLSIEIEPEALEDADASMLSDLVLAAVSDAQRSADEEIQKKMSSLMGGLGLPPGMGF